MQTNMSSRRHLIKSLKGLKGRVETHRNQGLELVSKWEQGINVWVGWVGGGGGGAGRQGKKGIQWQAACIGCA